MWLKSLTNFLIRYEKVQESMFQIDSNPGYHYQCKVIIIVEERKAGKAKIIRL